VLPAPRVPDGLTISPVLFRKQADSKAPTNHIPDNGKLDGFVIASTISEMQRDASAKAARASYEFWNTGDDAR
jgi:hypothetical protein